VECDRGDPCDHDPPRRNAEPGHVPRTFRELLQPWRLF
jgi:hypothetical protein